MKRVLKFTLSLVIAFSVLMIAACSKSNEGNLSNSSSEATNSTTTSITSSVAENSFNYSAKPSNSTVIDPADDEVKAEYPKISAMYQTAALDNTYNGTNAAIGFPSRLTRVANTYETYPVGYGVNTTGGRGAEASNIYECATGLEFASALSAISQKKAQDASVKSIIKITATITQANSTAVANPTNNDLVFQFIVNSIDNLSIIGINNQAIFDGVGLNFKSSDNVIVQNLTIHHPSKVLKNEKDCLEFNSCNNVWVDHCELYNDKPTDTKEKDYYDGLLDLKNDSSNITVSYNYFHDAFKTSLIGSGPDDVVPTRTVTFHHNKFIDCNSRLPLIRGGYGHMYNNYYSNIGTGINSRISANVFVENNIFENVKNPICSIEETVGYYNHTGNVFTNCSGSVNPTLTSNYTPSYEYILDSTDNLKAYLDATVGVNIIDISKAIAVDTENTTEYVIAKNLLIDRAIDELPTIEFNKDCLQRLVYISKQILFATNQERASLTKLTTLESAIDAYFTLYATSIDSRIASISTNGKFDENATKYVALKNELGELNSYVKGKITKNSEFESLTTYYNANFVSNFNSQVDSLANANSADMNSIKNLLDLYNGYNDKTQLKYQQLQDAYVKSDNCVKAESFVALVDALPSESAVALGDGDKVNSAKTAYQALTQNQLSLISTDKITKYLSVVQAYINLTNSSLKMDLTNVPIARTNAVTVAGNVSLGVSVDVKSTTKVFNGETFAKYAYLSGYGNAGSKCIQLNVYSKSTITLVIETGTAKADLVLTDPSKVVKQSFSTTSGEIQVITLNDVEVGEYRIFTIPASASGNSTTASIYALSITPQG